MYDICFYILFLISVGILVYIYNLYVEKLNSMNSFVIFLTGIVSGFALSFIIFLGVHDLGWTNSKSIHNSKEWFKIAFPVLPLLITSISLVLTTKNNIKSEQISDLKEKRSQVLDLINFTNDINKEVKSTEGNNLNDIRNKLLESISNDKFWLRREIKFIEIEVFDRGMGKKILEFINLNINVKKDTFYDIQLEKLKNLLEKNTQNNTKQIWLILNYILELKDKKFDSKFNKNIQLKINKKFIKDIIIGQKLFDELILESEDLFTKQITFDEIKDSFNDIFEENDNILEYYFRSVHRTLKKINESFSNNDCLKREYIGLLRSQMNNEMLSLIFYNAVYYEKGSGMGKQLYKSNFFGDENDFYCEGEKIERAQHFNQRNLIYFSEECFLIKDLFISDDSFSSFSIDKSEYKTKVISAYEKRKMNPLNSPLK